MGVIHEIRGPLITLDLGTMTSPDVKQGWHGKKIVGAKAYLSGDRKTSVPLMLSRIICVLAPISLEPKERYSPHVKETSFNSSCDVVQVTFNMRPNRDHVYGKCKREDRAMIMLLIWTRSYSVDEIIR